MAPFCTILAQDSVDNLWKEATGLRNCRAFWGGVEWSSKK